MNTFTIKSWISACQMSNKSYYLLKFTLFNKIQARIQYIQHMQKINNILNHRTILYAIKNWQSIDWNSI